MWTQAHVEANSLKRAAERLKPVTAPAARKQQPRKKGGVPKPTAKRLLAWLAYSEGHDALLDAYYRGEAILRAACEDGEQVLWAEAEQKSGESGKRGRKG